MKHLALICALSLLATPAFAEEAEPTETPIFEGEFCFPTADLKKELSKFEKLDTDKRDTVGAVFTVAFTLEDDVAPPESVELRDGEAVKPFPFSRYGDQVMTANLTGDIVAASDTAELCAVDQEKAGRAFDDMGYEFDMGLNVRFLDTPGTHDLTQLKDGMKDGRSHWKKMVGAMGFMVPKFDHIAVAGIDAENPPIVTALKDGVPVGTPEGEVFDGARMIDIDALEDLGADAVRIDADYYRLTPSPDAKTVKRFMGGD
jgi:hypothetical protein